MTIKFGNFANFIVRNFVVIWEASILRDFKGSGEFFAQAWRMTMMKMRKKKRRRIAHG